MIINIATCLFCVILLLFFRRIDKTNNAAKNVRQNFQKMSADIITLAAKEKRELSDSVTEADILIKQANNSLKLLTDMLAEISSRMKGIQEDNNSLKKVEDDIRLIASSAEDLNRQMEFIAQAKQDFTTVTDKILKLQQNITEARGESESLITEFSDKLRNRSRELTDEFAQTVAKHSSDLEHISEIVGDLENTVFEDIQTKTKELKETVKSSADEIVSLKDAMLGDVKREAAEIYNKIHEAEEDIVRSKEVILEDFHTELSNARSDIEKFTNAFDSTKSKIIEGFKDEVNLAKKEIDNINIVTIEKKEEIVQSARKQADELRKKMDGFDNSINIKISQMRDDYQNAEDRLDAMNEKIKKDFMSMEDRLAQIKEEIINYEQQNRVFERSDSRMEEVANSIDELGSQLSEAKKISEDITAFMHNADEFRDLRKNIDRELRDYQARKENIDSVAANIRNLMDTGDIAFNRMDEISSKMQTIDYVNNRLNALADSYSDLDEKINELKSYNNIIDKNLTAAEKTESIIREMDGKVQSFKSVVERSDKKAERLVENLKNIEEKTAVLNTKKRELEDLQEKFDYVDTLGNVMQQKVEQITAMYNKVEGIQHEIDRTGEHLQQMFTRTDEKMREFSSFIQTVEPENLISKQIKKKASAPNINEALIKTVRDLHAKGWEEEDIANKMDIDENSVRLIVNTSSL